MPAGQFADLSDFVGEVGGDPIVLPVRGVAFTFPGSPSIADGLRIRALRKEYEQASSARLAWIREAQAAEKAGAEIQPAPNLAGRVLLDDDAEAAMYRRFIPDPEFTRMEEHRVTIAEYKRIGETLFACYMYGTDVARLTWDGTLAALLDPPKAPANREARRRSARMSSTAKSPSTSTSPRKRPPAARGGTPSTKRGRSSKASSIPATEST